MKTAIAIIAAILSSAASAQEVGRLQFRNYEVSFAPGAQDAEGHVLGGTETRDLIAFGGKLYAGMNYWMDQQPHGNAQILVKDSSSAPWRQEVDMGDFCPTGNKACALAVGIVSVLNFKKDRSGDAVNVSVLAAGIWPTGYAKPVPIKAYTKNNSDGKWYETVIASSDNGQIRAFGSHQDKVTGEAMAFVHAGSIGVFHGWLSDKRGAGKPIVEWASDPEWIAGTGGQCTAGVGERIMAFAEAEGALFATKCFTVMKRIDGPQGNCKPDEVAKDGACTQRWVKFYSAPGSPSSESGYRGMTTITIEGKQYLLIGWEGANAVITRLDPTTAQAEVELDVSDTLAQAWGTPVGYLITSYSAPMPLWYGADGRGRRIIGFEAFIAKAQAAPVAAHSFSVLDNGARLEGGAWYFVRDAAHSYRLFRVPEVMGKPMVSLRTAASSPFPDECNAQGQHCAIYFGGFDANKSAMQTPCHAQPCNLEKQATHSTAWIVKGSD